MVLWRDQRVLKMNKYFDNGGCCACYKDPWYKTMWSISIAPCDHMMIDLMTLIYYLKMFLSGFSNSNATREIPLHWQETLWWSWKKKDSLRQSSGERKYNYIYVLHEPLSTILILYDILKVYWLYREKQNLFTKYYFAFQF